MPHHRRQKWLKLLKEIDAETPADLGLHLIVDNYATHKHSKVRAWLKRHNRFHMHIIPTRSLWLNIIERWFGKITQDRIRNGVFRSVPELVDAITKYIDAHNSAPTGFVWTNSAEQILKKAARAGTALHNSSTA